MVRQACFGRLSASALTLNAPAAHQIGHGTHFDGRHDGGHIGEPQRADAGAQRAVGAVARIHQHDTARDARRSAARICASAICGLVLKRIASGTCAFSRRSASSAQAFGRYSR